MKVFIPFRDRGIDMRRQANLDVVMAWWFSHGFEPMIVSDGLGSDAQFNRHRAYNRAVSGNPDVNTFVFTEADMLIHPDQINLGIKMAKDQPGLVVPFDEYRYLSDEMTAHVRDQYHDMNSGAVAAWWGTPVGSRGGVFDLHPESVMAGGTSIGAVNIVSRETLRQTGGFTEATRGNWYDDRITEEGFAFLTGRATEFVAGPAVHLYHLPGWKGDHLSHEDRLATEHNKDLYLRMKRAIRMRQHGQVRSLMEVRA